MVHHSRITIRTRAADQLDQEITIYVSGPLDPRFNGMTLDAYQSSQLKSLLSWSKNLTNDDP